MTSDERDSEQLDDEAVRREIAEHRLRFWRVVDRGRRWTAKAALWGLFFFLFWLLRDFFPLIFLTFVFGFVMTSAARLLGRAVPAMPWRGRVVIVFLVFVALFTGLVAVMVPQIARGVDSTRSKLAGFPELWRDEIDPWLYDYVPPYRRLVTEERVEERLVPLPSGDEPETGDADPTGPDAEAPAPVQRETVTIRERIQVWQTEQARDLLARVEGEGVGRLPKMLTDVVSTLVAFSTLLFLATLFGFLIVFDLETLRREVAKLRDTRLGDFYREVGEDLVRFGSVLGRVLEAQAVIALVNAFLTFLGLWAMDIPNRGFLTLTVFLCGFVPVAGVFISSVPICLVGLYSHGIETCLLLILFITGIHMLEAYVLNPRIMGAALKINPVLVLVILVVGHHALGVWGLLLGVPIAYYFFKHVIKKETPELGLGVRFTRRRRRTATETDTLDPEEL